MGNARVTGGTDPPRPVRRPLGYRLIRRISSARSIEPSSTAKNSAGGPSGLSRISATDDSRGGVGSPAALKG